MSDPRPPEQDAPNGDDPIGDGPSLLSPCVRYHASFLIASLSVIAAAGFLQIQERDAINLPGWGNLPSICIWENWLGLECPGCGLTRCFVAIAHGDLSKAWRFNPAGFLIFAVVVYQIPFRSIQLWNLKNGQKDYYHNIWLINLVVWSIVVGLLLQWFIKYAL